MISPGIRVIASIPTDVTGLEPETDRTQITSPAAGGSNQIIKVPVGSGRTETKPSIGIGKTFEPVSGTKRGSPALAIGSASICGSRRNGIATAVDRCRRGVVGRIIETPVQGRIQRGDGIGKTCPHGQGAAGIHHKGIINRYGCSGMGSEAEQEKGKSK